jgi:cell division protein FtsQ
MLPISGQTFEEPVAMDGRGRLAQPLKPKIKQRNAAARLQSHAQAWHAQGWPASAPGWRRLARRWWAALLDLHVPRGVGSSAAALLLLASASYGAVKGGHVPVMVAQVQDICDAAANRAGFRITEIALAGQHEVGREDILTLAGITGRSSLLFLDAARTRARLLTNPWIAEATVLKLYPGRLRIEIKERKAFALWQKDGRVALIAADGIVLETYVPRRFASLPQVVGQGAERAAADFLDLLARYPGIARLVEASVLVAERRWSLHLRGGVEVLLPEAEPERALMTLGDLARDQKLLARDIVAVDLRLADRVTVRLSDGAASARDAALKAADKDKKAKGGKGKGSDA